MVQIRSRRCDMIRPKVEVFTAGTAMINGELAGCCVVRGVDLERLRSSGLGSR